MSYKLLKYTDLQKTNKYAIVEQKGVKHVIVASISRGGGAASLLDNTRVLGVNNITGSFENPAVLTFENVTNNLNISASLSLSPQQNLSSCHSCKG